MNTPTHAVPRVTTLFVSPSDSRHAALRNIFLRSNWDLRSAYNCEEAIAMLHSEPIPVVICDRDLADQNWRFLLEKTEAIHPAPKVVVSSREVTEHLWADVLQMGGYDLLEMPWDSREVLKVISLAWRSWNFESRHCASLPPKQAPALARAAAAVAMAV